LQNPAEQAVKSASILVNKPNEIMQQV